MGSLSLQYWLTSINLPQYYDNFTLHGITNLEKIQQLTDGTLNDIGITLPGHQRRILTHLPDAESWHEEMSAAPSLPPKKNPNRTSFLSDDWKPTDGLPVSQAEVKHDSLGSEYSTVGQVDVAKDIKDVSPRPVPRPRTNKRRSADTNQEESEEKAAERPKPAPRPTPVPRKLSSPKAENKLSSEQKVCKSPDLDAVKESDKTEREDIKLDEIFVNKGEPAPSEIPFKEKLVNVTGTETSEYSEVATELLITHQGSLKIFGVCEEETSTDDVETADTSTDDFRELYSYPDKKKNRKTEHFRQEKSKTDNICKKDEENITEDDIYINLQDDMECENDNSQDKGATAKPITVAEKLTESYENADFDPFSKTYIPKPNGEDTIYIRTNIDEIQELPEACGAKIKENDDDESENLDAAVYEPIWVDKSDEKLIRNKRSSSLIQFSPTRKERPDSQIKPKDTRRSVSITAEQRMSAFLSRDSVSFDMPPPSFAPPPLPTSLADTIADFDPLSSVSSNMPPVPPRPSNYKPPTMFKPNENVNFQPELDRGSPTLPSRHGSMEPEAPINSPRPVHRADDEMIAVTDDPFKTEDPFGQFKPDVDDFDKDIFETLETLANKDKTTVIGPGETGTLKADQTGTLKAGGDAVYAFAEPVEDDFDPFGLNREAGDVSVPRSSLLSGSSETHVRLSEVPPPPNWSEASQEVGRMYSLTGNLNDGDSSSNGSMDDLLDGDQQSDDGSSSNMTQVEILPSSSLSPRKKERSGYLYKQGGVKQNRGWRKRWVIFDGKSLRYYSSSKDQISKRIVPLSCMENVEMDVRPSNSRQFKFKLACTNRVFLFATDSLDDCKLWSNTLMEAILTYKPPEGGEVPGGDMADPDIDDWLRVNKNRFKFYVVLKKHKLAYYQNADDYRLASPLHEIEMKLSSVKEVDRTKLQLNTHYGTFILNFESSSDASNWKMALEESITDALGDNSVLERVQENPSNKLCADCGAPDAHWASMNLSVVLCSRCAGIHRGFDLRLSKVRSLRMDTKVWNTSLIEMFKEIGNDNANNFWLTHATPDKIVHMNVSSEERKLHIHDKYKNKLYCDKHPLSEDKTQLNKALLDASQTDNVLLTYQILHSGGDILYTKPGKQDSTAFELAKEAHQRIQMEFLLQNGGDKTKNFMPGSEEASLIAKLRSEVQRSGYLYKTGSNMKDFLKRWCVLEHGHLSYYVSEESKVEKDRIENETLLCIQAVHHEKQPSCFEISCKKNNRVYLFSASSDEDRLAWMQDVAKVFCPVNLMEEVGKTAFCLAGYAYLKTGFNRDWQRTWHMLENRKLIFIDKEETERELDSVDLRKVMTITKIQSTQSACDACLEPAGPQFVLKAGDRMLYFQADLVKDTERMFSALESAVKKGGAYLEDQVLTNNDIPVIVDTCIDFIQEYGMRLEGLYRKAETESKIKALLQRFQDDARSVVLRMEDESVHLVCNVLKRFLRNLTDPLLTSRLYSRWIQTAGEYDHNVKLQWYKYLLLQLPRVNYLTLRRLASHLSKLSKHASENLMNLNNISIAFGSTLMKSEKSEDGTPVSSTTVGVSMQLEMAVISDIVLYHEWLFDVKEADRRATKVDEQIEAAKRKMRQTVSQPDDIMIFVYHLDPKGKAESVKINKKTTVSEVVSTLRRKLDLNVGTWVLHEMLKSDLERPLAPDMKIWPVVHEWQNWSSDYSSVVVLCLKSNELFEKIERAYDPNKPLFAELKYCDKKKFSKMAFEFTQARLSCYKDMKSMGNPSGSWNIEDLSIYKGCDAKRSPPNKHTFSFLTKGDRVGEKELPYFGRTVCCASESELYLWLAGLVIAQSCGGHS